MSRQQNGLAQRREVLHHLPCLPASRRVKASRRFVEKYQIRVADEPDSDVESPLLTSREADHSRVPFLLEANQLDEFLNRSWLGVIAAVHLDRLGDREIPLDAARLQDDAYLGAQLLAVPSGVKAENTHVTAAPRAISLENLDDRRLPSAVRAEQSEDL